MIEVELYGLPRLHAGVERCSAPAGRLRDVLRAVAAGLPGLVAAGVLRADGGLSEHVLVAIDGRVAADLEVEVGEGAVVMLVSAQAGG